MLEIIYKNGKTFTIFGEIQKQKLHQHKGLISVKKIRINKIVVSNKVSFGKTGFKYFIDYKGATNRAFCIFFPKMSAYKKDFDETKHKAFLIKDDELLKKYNEILEKVKLISKKNLILNQYTMKNI